MRTLIGSGRSLFALASVAALLQGGSCAPQNPGPAQPGPAYSGYPNVVGGNQVNARDSNVRTDGPCSPAIAGVGGNVTTNGNCTMNNNTNSRINSNNASSNNDNRRGIFGNENNNGNGTVNNSFGDAPSPPNR